MKIRGVATLCLATVALLATAPTPGYCWDKYAHEVICQIAYDRLTPQARAEADTLIAVMASDPLVAQLAADVKPYSFVTAGAWMDDMRGATRDFNSWHYIDLPADPNTTAAQVTAFTDGNPSNAYKALATFCIPTLKDPSAKPADRARALGFFLHIAGDIHQPLHASGREIGGNKYAIGELAGADPGWKITNLHSFWDNAYRYGGKDTTTILTVTGLDQPRIAYPGQDPVEQSACAIIADYAPTDPSAAKDIDPADWAAESARIAATSVFPADGAHTLAYDYIHDAHDIACRRIALAGLRMANLLNQLFAAPTK